jgi:hypothetical protein
LSYFKKAQKFDVVGFSPLEVRKQYRIEISNTFAALENLNGSEDINGVKMQWLQDSNQTM